jgi:hypothetical protein
MVESVACSLVKPRQRGFTKSYSLTLRATSEEIVRVQFELLSNVVDEIFGGRILYFVG